MISERRCPFREYSKQPEPCLTNSYGELDVVRQYSQDRPPRGRRFDALERALDAVGHGHRPEDKTLSAPCDRREAAAGWTRGLKIVGGGGDAHGRSIV